MKTLGVDKNGKWRSIFDLTPEENQMGLYALEIQDRELNGQMVTTYQIVQHWCDPNLFATNIDYEHAKPEEIAKLEDVVNEKLKNMGFPPYFSKEEK